MLQMRKMVESVLVGLLRSIERHIEKSQPPFTASNSGLALAVLGCHLVEFIELFIDQV